VEAVTGVLAKSNAAQPWDTFDTQAYFDHNYRTLLDPDQRILRRLAEFFGTQPLHGLHGIDVGTGANLYPAMAVIPLCNQVTLWERSSSNVEWLRRQVTDYETTWDPFWAELATGPLYAQSGNPRRLLADRAHVRRGDVFQLPENHWDLGTMFFVAESISGLRSEFEASLRSFLRSLRAGAPFAAAFMEGSRGYLVGSYNFPAVRVGVDDVASGVAGLTCNVDIQRIDTETLVREGYTGMILAVGVTSRRHAA
jgi:hypothetical protein